MDFSANLIYNEYGADSQEYNKYRNSTTKQRKALEQDFMNEKINDLAKQGWKLVAVTTEPVSSSSTGHVLFFEREVDAKIQA